MNLPELRTLAIEPLDGGIAVLRVNRPDRGVRTMTGGQGLHLWVQAQFPDRSVGFLTAESRDHERLLLEGAVMHEDGRLDPVTGVRHDLSFDDGLDLRGGLLEVSTAARWAAATSSTTSTLSTARSRPGSWIPR